MFFSWPCFWKCLSHFSITFLHDGTFTKFIFFQKSNSMCSLFQVINIWLLPLILPVLIITIWLDNFTPKLLLLVPSMLSISFVFVLVCLSLWLQLVHWMFLTLSLSFLVVQIFSMLFSLKVKLKFMVKISNVLLFIF